MEDVALTFNPTMFMDGIKQITDGISEVNRNMTRFGAQSTKKLKAVNVSAMSLLKGFALIKGAVGAARSALGKIPELGRSFSIAGDIISRNLLWPLRKELVPILQKMLDWVRDNRAMFVKWGNVIANVFRIIKSFVMGVWNFIKKIWQSFANAMKNVFGKTQQSISDLANIVLFKISSVISFIMLAIEPVAEFIGQIFATMMKAGMAFLKGLSKAMSDFLPSLDELMDAFKDLAKAIGLSNVEGGGLIAIFKLLGGVVGNAVMTVINGITTAIESLTLGIKGLPIVIKGIKLGIKGDWEGVRKNHKELEKMQDTFFAKQKKRWSRRGAAWKETIMDYQKEGSGIPGIGTMGVVPKAAVINTNKNKTNNDNRRNNVVNQNIKITNNINGNKSPSEIQNDVAKGIRDALNEEKFRRGGR